MLLAGSSSLHSRAEVPVSLLTVTQEPLSVSKATCIPCHIALPSVLRHAVMGQVFLMFPSMCCISLPCSSLASLSPARESFLLLSVHVTRLGSPDHPGHLFILRPAVLMTSTKSLLPCRWTYSQGLGFGARESLGGGVRYSIYHVVWSRTLTPIPDI